MLEVQLHAFPAILCKAAICLLCSLLLVPVAIKNVLLKQPLVYSGQNYCPMTTIRVPMFVRTWTSIVVGFPSNLGYINMLCPHSYWLGLGHQDLYGSLFKPSPCYWASESEHHTSCSQVVLICSYAINLAHAIKHMTNYTSWISHDTVNMALATTSLLTSTTIVTSLRSATFDTSFSSSIAKMHADSSCLPQNVLHSLQSYSSQIFFSMHLYYSQLC